MFRPFSQLNYSHHISSHGFNKAFFGQDLVGVRGSSPDFEALNSMDGDAGDSSRASPHHVLVFNDIENMRRIDPSETSSIPDLTPGTDSDSETLSMFAYNGDDGERTVRIDENGELLVTRKYLVPEEERDEEVFEELERCFKEQKLSPGPSSPEFLINYGDDTEMWGKYGELKNVGKICADCFGAGVPYEMTTDAKLEHKHQPVADCVVCGEKVKPPMSPLGDANTGVGFGASIEGAWSRSRVMV